MRHTFKSVMPTVDEDGRLWVDGKEVSIVYFRDGYSPEQFDEITWAKKVTLELNRAVKCPCTLFI